MEVLNITNQNNKTITLISSCIDTIESIAKRMIIITHRRNNEGFNVEAFFNGVLLSTKNMNNIEDIIEQYQYKYELLFNNKKGYIKPKKEKNTDELNNKLSLLDINSIEEILNFIVEMVEYSEYDTVNYNLLKKLSSKYVSFSDYMKGIKKSDYKVSSRDFILMCNNKTIIGEYIISKLIYDIEELGRISFNTFNYIGLYMVRFKCNTVKKHCNIL